MSFINSKTGHIYLDVLGKPQLSRVIMEEHLGRSLRSDELVHHIDNNPTNNDITNLQIVTCSEHMYIHKPHSTPHSEESKDKMSRAHMGNTAHLGHPHSEETKAQIGKQTSIKGRVYWSNLTPEQYAERTKNMGRKV